MRICHIMMVLAIAAAPTPTLSADAPPAPAQPADDKDAVVARCKALNEQREQALKERAATRDTMSKARWEAILTRVDEEQRRLNCSAGST